MPTRLLAAIVTCLVLGAAPALADHRHGGYYRGASRAVVVHRPACRHPPRIVYAAPAYYGTRARQRTPVYVAAPAYYPAPAYYDAPVYSAGPGYGYRGDGYRNHGDVWGWIGAGALVGAILHDVHHHH